MLEKLKIGLLLFAIVITFFLLAPYLLRLNPFLTNTPRIVVEYPTAVQGRITGSYVNRQYHLYYLDGNTEQYYDFNAFVQPLTPVQQQLTQDKKNVLGLGQKLKTGDIISKAANSTVLTVQRGDKTSRWFCSTPQEEEQAQQAAR